MAPDPTQLTEIANVLATAETTVAQLGATLSMVARCPTCEDTIRRIAAMSSQLSAILASLK